MNATSFRRWTYGVISTLSVLAAGALGQIATFPNLAPWYAGLHKPSFNPPNWIFGPIWTTLFVLMAIAAWRVLMRPQETPGRSTALWAYFLQLALNAAWSWAFFAAHSPALGLVDIVPQLAAIVLTVVLFARVDVIAATCIAPLALWVGFAALLNFEIWRLNG